MSVLKFFVFFLSRLSIRAETESKKKRETYSCLIPNVLRLAFAYSHQSQLLFEMSTLGPYIILPRTEGYSQVN